MVQLVTSREPLAHGPYQGSGSVGIDFRNRAGTRIECKGANLQEDALSLRLVAVQIMRMAGENIWSWVVLGDVLVMIYVIRQSGRNGGVVNYE